MNIIYVDFKRKVLDQRKSLKDKWDRVHQLDKWIHSDLTSKQYARYTVSTKFIERAKSIVYITKSLSLRKYATEMIDLINEINLEKNTIEKVYSSNDVPF